MKILLVTATSLEAQDIIEKFKMIDLSDQNLIRFEFEGHNVDWLVAGVGAPIFTYYLTNILNNNKYDIVINAGIAGSFNEDIAIGKVVNVTSDLFADLGIDDQGSFKTIFEENLIKNDQFLYEKEMLKNTTLVNNKYLNDLRDVAGVSVNTVSGSKKRINEIIDKFNPNIESMEGAAFHFVCLKEKVPFIQLRAISNYVEDRDKRKWNIPLALDNLAESIINIIKSI